MKLYLYGFWMCQSMFCAIPFPGSFWKEEARDKMLLCLPLVGLEIGLLWGAIGWLCGLLNLPQSIRGLALCAYPFLVTGDIHLDGYMDVLDAVKSCRSLERRREILKDSHVGAFAVIGCVLLMVAQYAFCVALGEGYVCLILLPVASRCCSVLAVSGLKPMSTSQYSRMETPRRNLIVPGGMLALAIAAGFALWGRQAAALVGAAVVHGLSVRRGYRSLEGMNGDISGYALTMSELAGIAIAALL